MVQGEPLSHISPEGVRVRRSLPLLKWPGGKRELVRHILPLIPTQFGTYFEPFLGGGALFFALAPEASVLSDHNRELMTCYEQVRDYPGEVIHTLSAMPNSSEDYYRIRGERPTDLIEIAARLIYLTTLSFNGIHRVNLRGEFNVPYGRKLHVDPCDPVRIKATSQVLTGSTLRHGDFSGSLTAAKSGDVVYLDPPYTVAHGQNGFVKYNAKIFAWKDQIRLAEIASHLDRRGCHVIVSNANHDSVRRLYPSFEELFVPRPSRISAASAYRGSVVESLFHNRRPE